MKMKKIEPSAFLACAMIRIRPYKPFFRFCGDDGIFCYRAENETLVATFISLFFKIFELIAFFAECRNCLNYTLLDIIPTGIM